jgi:hypothetical protein
LTSVTLKSRPPAARCCRRASSAARASGVLGSAKRTRFFAAVRLAAIACRLLLIGLNLDQ